jgi:hypothetical protein
MPSTYSALKIELPATGEQSGTWGNTTNTNLGTALEEAITGSADVAFSSADVTLTLTDTNAAQIARNLRLNLTGTSGGARQLILGSGCQIEKFYLINNGLADAVTVKNTAGTGISVPAGRSVFLFNNGTDVVDAVNYLSALNLGTALAIVNGGTGATTNTAARTNLGATTVGANVFTLTNPSAITFPRFNADNTVSTLDAATFRTAIGAGTGTVTSVATGTGLTGGPITGTGTIAIDSTVATLTGSQVLTNKTISVDDNTVSGIATSSFVLSNGSGNIDGAAAQKAIPSGVVVGTTDTQTLTNKTITARVDSSASITSPLAWNSDNYDQYAATAQAGDLTINADAGTPTDGRKIVFRITSDGTPRVITFTGGASKGFKPVGVTLTVSGSNFTYTLTASKTTYFGAIYNITSARWEIVALSQEA